MKLDILTEKFWDAVHKKCGEDLIDMAVDVNNGNITTSELIDKIAKRCDVTAKLTLKQVLRLPFNRRDVGGVNPEWALSDQDYQALKQLTGEPK